MIYVLSGFSGAGDLVNNQVYNPLNNSWVSGTNVPTPVWLPGATAGNDGRIYLIGGEPAGGGTTNLVQIYNPQTGVWSNGTPMPTARKQLQTVAVQSGLIFARRNRRTLLLFPDGQEAVRTHDSGTSTIGTLYSATGTDSFANTRAYGRYFTNSCTHTFNAAWLKFVDTHRCFTPNYCKSYTTRT